ncbi:MAG TPA: cytochrome c oxidase assembly protein [Woeseiaceae bacterium]|nr:cytochrome c oxidase assembly protein [Woeseiaceae bacterium]
MSEENRQESTGWLAIRLAAVAVGMFGFGYLLVPAYSVFCEITGLGGRTNETPVTAVAAPEMDRSVDIEFVTTVHQAAPWTFEAEAPGMSVHPGGIYEAMFVAENLSGHRQIAQAVPSIAPSGAAEYFKKLECFCFTTQEFAPNEERELLVRFVVDRDLPEYFDTITLSYTLFDTNQLADASGSTASAR